MPYLWCSRRQQGQPRRWRRRARGLLPRAKQQRGTELPGSAGAARRSRCHTSSAGAPLELGEMKVGEEPQFWLSPAALHLWPAMEEPAVPPDSSVDDAPRATTGSPAPVLAPSSCPPPVSTASPRAAPAALSIYGVCLVAFDHAIGPAVEFVWPAALEADVELNRSLPFLALPDGAHTVRDPRPDPSADALRRRRWTTRTSTCCATSRPRRPSLASRATAKWRRTRCRTRARTSRGVRSRRPSSSSRPR